MAPRTTRAKKEVKSEVLSAKNKPEKMKMAKNEEPPVDENLDVLKGTESDNEDKKLVPDIKNSNKEKSTKGRNRKQLKKNELEEHLSDQENYAANVATDEKGTHQLQEKNVKVRKAIKKVENQKGEPASAQKDDSDNGDSNKLTIEKNKSTHGKGRRGQNKNEVENSDEGLKTINEKAEAKITNKRGKKAQNNLDIEKTAEKTTNGTGIIAKMKNILPKNDGGSMEVDVIQTEASESQEDAKPKSRGKKTQKKDRDTTKKSEVKTEEVEEVPKGRTKKTKNLKNHEEPNEADKPKAKERIPRKKMDIEEANDDNVDNAPTLEKTLKVDDKIEKLKGKGRAKKNLKQNVVMEFENSKGTTTDGTDLHQSTSDTKTKYLTVEDSDNVSLNSKPVPKQAAKGKRGASTKTQKAEKTADEKSQDDQEPPSKKSKVEGKKPLKNKAVTDFEGIDFSNLSKTAQGDPWNLKICSWNVDGIRAWLTKGGLDYIKYEKPDILCLQEVKCAQKKLPEEVVTIPGYHPYWLCSDDDAYAGVGIYTTKMAITVKYGLQDEELDAERRIITAEYEQFYLICTYVPNAGRKLVTLPKRLKWNEIFHKHVKELDAKKPVIICGDMNVAHSEIDLTNPKTNKKNAGFTEEERAGMTALLNDGFVDTFRHLYPEKPGAYTFWTYMMNSRAKNVGWRLDYMIVSERLLPSLCDNVIRSEVFGSDHCPIALFLHLNSVPKIPTE